MTVSDNLEVLSERELEVLKLVATGATNQQIARDLVISPNTVKVHLRNIFEKLGVQSRTEATMEAVRRGWVHVPGEVQGSLPAVPEPIVLVEPAAPELPPISLPDLMPHAPARKPVAPWQRALLIVALLLAVLGTVAPSWLSPRTAAATLTAFTDVGRPQVSPPVRVAVQRWSAVAPLPEARSRLALAADGSRLYALGGETADGVTGELSIYDPKTNGWLPGVTKPTPVANIGAGVIGGRVYVPGGSTANGGVSDALEIYDPATDTWSSGPKLPRPLAAYTLTVWGDKLYLFGGWDGSAYRRETLIFDPASGMWVQGPLLPGARASRGPPCRKTSSTSSAVRTAAAIWPSCWRWTPRGCNEGLAVDGQSLYEAAEVRPGGGCGGNAGVCAGRQRREWRHLQRAVRSAAGRLVTAGHADCWRLAEPGRRAAEQQSPPRRRLERRLP